MRLAGGRVAHHFQVAVVGGDDQRAATCAHRSNAPMAMSTACAARIAACRIAAVADHVRDWRCCRRWRRSDPTDRGHQLVGQFRAAHLRLQVVGGDLRAGHQDALLAGEQRPRGRR
jgi:hypothetical protein